MPIGGSAYYDKFRKNRGQNAQDVQTPNNSQQLPVKASKFTKSLGPVGRSGRSAKKITPSGKLSSTNPSALDGVVSQILDLAQRVHAVAGQAEAAVLRAEAAVLKAEVAVGKAEAAGSRADAAFSKCDVAVSRADSAAFKSESSAKRAELSASKAGLAAGRSDLSSVGRDVANIMSDANSLTATGAEVADDTPESADDEDNRTKQLNSPINQITVMSMKLRSGMRQIEEERAKTLDRAGFLNPNSPLNITLGREDLASGLVSLDHETALPRVAPFIMEDAGKQAPATDAGNQEVGETENQVQTNRNGLGSAA